MVFSSGLFLFRYQIVLIVSIISESITSTASKTSGLRKNQRSSKKRSHLKHRGLDAFKKQNIFMKNVLPASGQKRVQMLSFLKKILKKCCLTFQIFHSNGFSTTHV